MYLLTRISTKYKKEVLVNNSKYADFTYQKFL